MYSYVSATLHDTDSGNTYPDVVGTELANGDYVFAAPFVRHLFRQNILFRSLQNTQVNGVYQDQGFNTTKLEKNILNLYLGQIMNLIVKKSALDYF